MTLHLARIGGITVLSVLCIFYPFLPGKYDGLAVPLSIIAQLFGAAGLLLVPISALWLAAEVRRQAQRSRNPPQTGSGYYFAIVLLIAASVLTIAISLATFLGISHSLGTLTLALWFYAVSRWMIPGLKRLKQTKAEAINPTPLYLIVIPVAVLLFQAMLVTPLTEFSRNYAITQSAELIRAIEQHRVEYGRYPNSLLALWPDYSPSVVGIEQFRYALSGDAYNLAFEQPKLLFDNIGTLEFVVYNKLDEQLMPSHAAWILLWSPERLAANQGWYEAHDTTSPHWKYFWFD